MKTLLTSILVLVASTQYVQAYDGKISFQGSIVDTPSNEQLSEFTTQIDDLKHSIESDIINKSIRNDDIIPTLKKWSNNSENYKNYTWIEKIEVQAIKSNAVIFSVNYI